MMNTVITVLNGVWVLPWWGYLIVLAILTQLTILSVTIFLHRCQAHRAVELHPVVSHFFRLWLWLTTGMITKEWTAVHRKHHARVETSEDPHSPQISGIRKVLFEGTELYRQETKNKETLERYGQGTPDDWIERHIYTPHSVLGIMITLLINFTLFGAAGIAILAVQLMWIPFWAAGVINGIGHYWGYRNFECEDASRNIFPIGFFIGGEELHNNHHTYGTSAKFSVKWWEVDIGWSVIRVLQWLRLATPKRVPPPDPRFIAGRGTVDLETVKAILAHRFQVLAQYSNDVIIPVLQEERSKAPVASAKMLQRMRNLLIRNETLVNEQGKQRLARVLGRYRSLATVYQFRLGLQAVWAHSTRTQKELVEALQEWCHQAEATGIEVLKNFVARLKSYIPQPVLEWSKIDNKKDCGSF